MVLFDKKNMTVIGSCGYYPLDIDRTELSDNLMISHNDRSHVGKKFILKIEESEREGFRYSHRL